MPSVSDAWANHAVRTLLSDLADRGVRVSVRAGRLHVTPVSVVTDEELARLRQDRADALILTLVCDDRTLDRLIALRGSGLPSQRSGGCYWCGEPLPPDRRAGRCGWCALACRLYAGGPISPDLLALFPEEIRGPFVRAANGLAFDTAAPRLDFAESA